jgi:hypothetical protein
MNHLLNLLSKLERCELGLERPAYSFCALQDISDLIVEAIDITAQDRKGRVDL